MLPEPGEYIYEAAALAKRVFWLPPANASQGQRRAASTTPLRLPPSGSPRASLACTSAASTASAASAVHLLLLPIFVLVETSAHLRSSGVSGLDPHGRWSATSRSTNAVSPVEHAWHEARAVADDGPGFHVGGAAPGWCDTAARVPRRARARPRRSRRDLAGRAAGPVRAGPSWRRINLATTATTQHREPTMPISLRSLLAGTIFQHQ